MLKHMGFTCWVTSGDLPLQTYSEESLGNVRAAWIASTPGKSFAVHWQDHSGKRIATSGHVLIDGKDVASAIIRPGRQTPVKRTGAKVRRNVIKPFVFTELSLTDDDDLASPYDTSLGRIGSIRIEITRVRLGAEVPFAGYDKAQDPGVVHERAKKAGAHCTNFGDAKHIERARTVSISTAPYDPNEPGPFVVFEFRYRSFEMLKAIGIVQIGRKRLNESATDDVIEIDSSDDEASSTTLHPSSRSPSTPSKKRVKTEPRADSIPSLPESSPPKDIDEAEAGSQLDTIPLLPSISSSALENTSDQPKSADDSLISQSQTQPDNTQASERAPSPVPSRPSIVSTAFVKEENEDDEELDMLAGDSEYTLSTDPSQNVEDFPVDLPPPSSSPGPEALVEEEEEENNS
ncbi:hypothetical protein ACEPAF_8047 [Sanghuangporus sanghuang]